MTNIHKDCENYNGKKDYCLKFFEENVSEKYQTCKYIHGVSVDDVYESRFSINKLKEMLQAKSLSKDCTLSLGDDLPLVLKLESSMGDCRLEFLLAPRISDEG